jgi:pSer/pThr/pTyr-binding forkhead associated (FHA) protein
MSREPLTLRCTRGPLAGEDISVETELVLGREEDDPGRLGGDPRLSRRHARIWIDESGQAMVEDLGSTNGTWLNEKRVSEACALGAADQLRLGESLFEVELPQPEVSAESGATIVDSQAGELGATIVDSPPLSPRLKVVAGPAEGEEIALAGELLIGRAFGEPGALGGDRLLSRRHARIACGEAGAFFIEDTGSTNGTTVNRVLIRRAQALKDGDEIGLGTSTLSAIDLPGAPLADELEDGPPSAVGNGGATRASSAAGFAPQGEAPARFSSRLVIALFAAVFGAAAIAAVVVVLLAAPLGSRTCPQGFICHKPPTAPPLQALTVFTGSLGWRVEYDPQMAAPSTASVSGNQLELHETAAGDRLLGTSAGSRSILVVVQGFRATQLSAQAALQRVAGNVRSSLVGAATAPSSDQMFATPALGFHNAVGEVLEGSTQTPQGPGELVKVAAVAATSGAVTVAAAVVYPVQQGTRQQDNPDRPFDSFGDQVLETVRFPSDGGA